MSPTFLYLIQYTITNQNKVLKLTSAIVKKDTIQHGNHLCLWHLPKFMEELSYPALENIHENIRTMEANIAAAAEANVTALKMRLGLATRASRKRPKPIRPTRSQTEQAESR